MKILEEYQTEIDPNVPIEDYQEIPILKWPREKLNSLVKTWSDQLFLSSVSEYDKGVFRGVVIKTDESQSYNLLDSVYFIKPNLNNIRLFYMGNQIHAIKAKNCYKAPNDVLTHETVVTPELSKLLQKRITEHFIKKGYSHDIVLALNFVGALVKKGTHPKTALKISADFYGIKLKKLTSANASKLNIIRWTKYKFYQK